MYNASGWNGGLLNPGAMVNPDRNWGANPQKNQWIAGVTGYGGDFGGGGFQGLLGGLSNLYGNMSPQVSRSFTSQPGYAGSFPALGGGIPTANSGSTMLWTV